VFWRSRQIILSVNSVEAVFDQNKYETISPKKRGVQGKVPMQNKLEMFILVLEVRYADGQTDLHSFRSFHVLKTKDKQWTLLISVSRRL
jgi:hypothetical protein